MTEDQLELLRDKYVLWERASRQGPMDSRDYSARCAEALKAALCIISAPPREAVGVGIEGASRTDIARTGPEARPATNSLPVGKEDL